MQRRLQYAKTRLSVAIERFLSAQRRDERVLAARWVTAWAMKAERCGEDLHKQQRQHPRIQSARTE